jgi:uncharacterized Zn-binding protein involved in type VI secretion
MPAAARGNRKDTVASKTGTGPLCSLPVTTATDQCSPNVFTNGIGSVRQGDRVAPHPRLGCSTDTSVLTTHSPNVFVNGKGFGRLGDQYTPDNTITSGSSNVFVN